MHVLRSNAIAAAAAAAATDDDDDDDAVSVASPQETRY